MEGMRYEKDQNHRLMHALIINYNRITLPAQTAQWCHNQGLTPIIIDNASDYPPLLDYYQSRCPYPVVRMEQNYGHMVVWHQSLLRRLGVRPPYVVTDPDLDYSQIPGDWLKVFSDGLRKYPTFDKIGFSLEIDDVKNQNTVDWEQKFWQYPLDDLYYNAPIDTTFAMYKTDEFSFNSIRTGRPYTVRHLPWYYNHIKDLPEDERYYYQTQNEDTASHTNVKKD